jgi:hypothetical protein
MNARTRLLHNMSAPPKSVVKYEGLSGLALHRSPGGTGLTSVGYRNPAVFGRYVRFELPQAWRGLDALGILRSLEVAHDEAIHGRPERHLQMLVNQRADALPLPEGCAVVPTAHAHPMPWPDPLAALAVLSKSTDTVWLRGKTPALVAAVQREAVSLLVPPAFADRIAELNR